MTSGHPGGPRLTAPPGTPGEIAGIGVHHPRTRVGNAEIAARLHVDEQWITSRTGVQGRHRAEDCEPLERMAAEAAQDALLVAGTNAADLDCVILATITNPQQTPAVAARVAATIGARAAAFDLAAACAGFCHGLEVARSLIAAGTARSVLVIGADRMLDIVDPDDPGTAPLFGDGAGAALVRAAHECGIGPVAWCADGTRADALETRPTLNDSSGKSRPYLRMQGTAVARWAIANAAAAARRAMDVAGVEWADLHAFVPHQANQRLTETLVRLLDMPAHVAVADDIRVSGNTSGASVPLAVYALRADGRLPANGLALLVGFGAGMSCAAQVVRIP
ncbi:beta-ketoacyl-ACP synthase 3 [Kitasatospora sp. NPDC059463]|uniref:beta-ketoacyl-ACP synthase 3 n=1 Tax=unclassified Kitasatospora TaxID=2633591 RepID=UPI0036BBDA67